MVVVAAAAQAAVVVAVVVVAVAGVVVVVVVVAGVVAVAVVVVVAVAGVVVVVVVAGVVVVVVVVVVAEECYCNQLLFPYALPLSSAGVGGYIHVIELFNIHNVVMWSKFHQKVHEHATYIYTYLDEEYSSWDDSTDHHGHLSAALKHWRQSMTCSLGADPCRAKPQPLGGLKIVFSPYSTGLVTSCSHFMFTF